MNTDTVNAIATSIRALSMDGVQKANSGHPGLPMGCAELGALLYGDLLRHDPSHPDWIDRDRFILSAGHGSMLLYSLLYLSGYGLTKEDLMNFRRLGSKTPGHPEYGMTVGVETTTGPLGAGFSNAVGLAIAERMLAAKFNTPKQSIIDHYTYVLSGDGCMMEGITSEAASLAGHLRLGKLIVFYDSNSITIEGSTDLAFTEDVLKRYEAYGWQTLSGDMYDVDGLRSLISDAKSTADTPTIILLQSTIGMGSPNMAGSHEVHGAPLGDEEIAATRRNLGIPEDESFYVDQKAFSHFESMKPEWSKRFDTWQAAFDAWAAENPELKKLWDTGFSKIDPHDIDMPKFEIGDSMATRKAGGAVLKAAAANVPCLVGGSADLAPSNNTAMPGGDFKFDTPEGRTLHFGVREHAMGGITNGLALHGGLRPFCATFLVFSDYMRPSIRLASLMKQPVIYVFTHDSIFVGEDGPTHQPVEHLASLRIIPGLTVLRPGDAQETAIAWSMALTKDDGPVALALTRQNLPVYEKSDSDWMHTITRGAYVVKECNGTPEIVVVATGSEVSLALEAAEKVSDKKIRVVSMLSRELFLAQDQTFRRSILPEGVRVVTTEAGVSCGWDRFASSPEDMLHIDRFGESGPAKDVANHFGFTADALAEILRR
jgi:transketolase